MAGPISQVPSVTDSPAYLIDFPGWVPLLSFTVAACFGTGRHHHVELIQSDGVGRESVVLDRRFGLPEQDMQGIGERIGLLHNLPGGRVGSHRAEPYALPLARPHFRPPDSLQALLPTS